MPGKLIVFEGLDGSGLTTQATLLRNHLLKKGNDVVLTKEPTDGLLGGVIKSSLRKEWTTNPLALQMLFAADRAHHLVSEIEPAIKKNKIVICDRYILSTLAFGSLHTSMDILKKLNAYFMKPHLTIIIDAHPKICMERMKRARHHVELFEEEHKLMQIRSNYMALKRHFPNTQFVDGNKDVTEVHEEVKRTVGRNV